MFDEDPRLSFAVLELTRGKVSVHHHRLHYDIEKTVAAIKKSKLPLIYGEMFRTGTKTN